jgi:hypothetical protein
MNPPNNQLSTGLMSGSLRIINRLVTAPASDAIATPASINVVNAVPLACRAIMYAMTTATIPPANAAAGRTLIPTTNNGTPETNTIVAPNPAPDATPIRYGSASGFLNKPWYAAPHVAKAPPTIPANTTLGQRSCHKIVSHVDGQSASIETNGSRETSILTTSPIGIPTDPWLTANNATTTTAPEAATRRHQGYRRPTDTGMLGYREAGNSCFLTLTDSPHLFWSSRFDYGNNPG